MSWADTERRLQDRITGLTVEKNAAVDDLARALRMVRKLQPENARLREVVDAADVMASAIMTPGDSFSTAIDIMSAAVEYKKRRAALEDSDDDAE